MDAANILQSILGDALGDIEGASAVKEMMKRESEADEAQRKREIAIVAAALGGDAGREFMKWLALKTILRSPNDGELSATTAEAQAIASSRRVGQNQIFFLIVDVLAQAGKPAAEADGEKPQAGRRKRKGSEE